jgi:hypothetical protein
LLETLNRCWNTCNFSDEWSKVIICPIFKKGDYTDAGNYRPISLLNTGLKLFTMLMSNRLNSWCEEKKSISDSQAAYRKGYGCEDHIFVLNAALQANTSERRKLFALFIDLSKAFDSIRHERLWSKLKAIGISGKFLRNIQSIYANAKAHIRTRHGTSKEFPLKNSVFQGETLSPKLFTLFIEDIVKILYQSGVTSIKIGKAELDILLYADDMVLLAYNVFDLQSKINVLCNYFKQNDLQINLSKTKCVIFRRGNRKIMKPTVFWNDGEIEIVDKYIYLGVPFYSNMKSQTTCNDFIVKGRNAERLLFELYWKAKIDSLESRLTLFVFSSFQFSFWKKLFRLPRYTPHWFLSLESQMKKIEVSFIRNVLIFWTKIMCRKRDSLVFKCYEFLRQTKNKPSMKQNWFRDFYNLLESYDCSDIVSSFGELCLENFNSHECKRAITVILGKLNCKMVESDLARMNNSKRMPNLKQIKTHCRIEDIMKSTIPWPLKVLFVQIRTNIPRIMSGINSVNLNALNLYFDNSSDISLSFCPLCTLNDPETLFHVIFRCPGYIPLRNSLINVKNLPYIPPRSNEEFVIFCTKLDVVMLRFLSLFFEGAMKVREEWLDE